MDQTSPSQQSTEPQKVGLFEILLVGIVLIFFFGTLNYFNILSISNVFPNQLGWLPHIKQDSKISYNTKIPAIKQQNTDISTASAKFSYDAVKASKALEKYIRDNIKEEFLPSKIEVKQHLIPDNTFNGTDYVFGVNWDLENIIFRANFHYLPNTNQTRDMEFYINPLSSNVSVDTANSALLTKTYLKNLPEAVDFECGVFEKSTKFCEHFLEKEAGKSGFGAVEGKGESGKNLLLIFSCFIPKDTSYYDKRTSCLLFREKDPRGL